MCLEERDEPLGPRRWLVLPAIAVVVVPVLGALFLGPIIGLGQAGFEEGWFAGTVMDRTLAVSTAHEGIVRTALILLGLGTWWLLLATFWGRLHRAVASFARPLYTPSPKHRRRFAIAGAIFTILGIAAILLAGHSKVLG